MRYTLVDAAGNVVGEGSGQECDLPPPPPGGKLLREAAAPADFSRLWQWNGQSFVDKGPRFPPNPARDARVRRANLLQACDWTQLPDVAPEVQRAWAPYRQALRDLPAQPGFPTTITWPKTP